jgi:HrpA-like RNA helicase
MLTKEQFDQLRNQPNPQILEHDLKDFIIHMKSLDIDFEDLDLFAKPGN